MKVVKFGGSSLACKESILKARDIVLEDVERRFVVVSAPGKCKEFPRKVTDLLIDAQAELSADDCNGWECSESLNSVIARFKKLSKDVGVDMADEIRRTHEEICINCQDRDFVVSRGEYLMAILFARVLDFRFVDSASLIVIQAGGKFHEAATRANFARKVNKGDRVVMPGFYGTANRGLNAEGITRSVQTFARGGSDYSVAIAAVCVQASVCEIFTDTYGVQTANPTLVKNTKTVAELDFATMHKLSIAGASVLHPDCLPLLRSHAVPLEVDNTFDHGIHRTVVSVQSGGGKYFCITYRFEQNINKDMVEILCVFNKLGFELSDLRKLLAGVEVYLVGFKKREFTLIAPSVNLGVVINKLHSHLVESYGIQ